MANNNHYETFELPLDTIEASCGFSFDIGGSTAKVIYRSNEDYKDGKLINKKEGQTKGHIRMVTIPRDEINLIIKEIKDHCDVTRPGQKKHVVHVTGVGCNFYKEKIEKDLDVQLEILSEFEVFGHALHTLRKSFTDEELFTPKPENGIADGLAKAAMWAGMTEMEINPKVKFFKIDIDSEEERSGRYREESKFPFVLVQAGSAFSYMKISEDGTMEIIDFSQVAGRFYLGVSSILADESDFDKLYKMVEENDGRTVDVYTDELKPPKKEGETQDNNYSQMPDGIMMFPFGKGGKVPKEMIKKGDMVRSMLQLLCLHMAQITELVCMSCHTKRAYLCGSFVNLPLVRDWVTSEIISRNMTLPKERRIDFQFIKNGGYIGAIGALLLGGEANKVDPL